MEPSKKADRSTLSPLRSIEQPKTPTPLTFVTCHPKKPGLFNLHQFQLGLIKSRNHWGGNFRGRPKLVEELAPHIYDLYSASPASTCANVTNALRRFWRMFDSLDAIAPVQSVTDITEIHEAEQYRLCISSSHTNTFLRLVNARRMELGLSKLFWAKPDKGEKGKHLPDHEHVKEIYEDLKRRSWDSIARVRERREMQGGADWAASHRPIRSRWDETDQLATYRGFIALTAHPCPSWEVIKDVTGRGRIDGLSVLYEQEQMYFRLDDVRALFHLFILLTGWNAQTALDINLDDDPVQKHPTAVGFHVVHAIKTRGGTEQVAIGQDKRELSPGNILRLLQLHTKPLRDYVLKQLDAATLAGGDHQEIAELRRWAGSPWLYPVRGGIVKALDESSSGKWDNDASFLGHVIAGVNLSRAQRGKGLIPDSITPRSLRDAFISFAYERSGYNWLIAKLAAGHKDLNTTRVYLMKTHWSRFGNSQVRKLVRSIWKDIEERRIVEPAFLYAMVQRGEITDAQRVRWLEGKDRTRVGVGCRSFKSPPKYLSPEHTEGAGCRVFRCVICPHAVLFGDSVSYLTRRQVELESLRMTVSVLAWEQSTFPDELETLRVNLGLFDQAEVVKQLTHWRSEVAAGRHLIPDQEGMYG